MKKNPCVGKYCGEAGCHFNETTGEAVCLCTESGKSLHPPDENFKCSHSFNHPPELINQEMSVEEQLIKLHQQMSSQQAGLLPHFYPDIEQKAGKQDSPVEDLIQSSSQQHQWTYAHSPIILKPITTSFESDFYSVGGVESSHVIKLTNARDYTYLSIGIGCGVGVVILIFVFSFILFRERIPKFLHHLSHTSCLVLDTRRSKSGKWKSRTTNRGNQLPRITITEEEQERLQPHINSSLSSQISLPLSSSQALHGISSMESSFMGSMTVVGVNPSYYDSGEPGGLLQNLRDLSAPLIPATRLRLHSEIGQGAFGVVFKGELLAEIEDVSSETKESLNVAVKVLKSNCSNQARRDFIQEVRTISAFQHNNILHFIGIVLDGEVTSPYMIFEYMEHGDLASILQGNDPCSGIPRRLKINQDDSLSIAHQVAQGMTYLASQRFVHGDLAARNCLVGSRPACPGFSEKVNPQGRSSANERFIVKIADFGMSRDIYTSDYYKVGSNCLMPVRWMSLESVRYGKFTLETDVWSYGVLLWEIFSTGRQPYTGYSNREVIKLLEEGVLLEKPNLCPQPIYDVMLGCWMRNPKERLNFQRIVAQVHTYRQLSIRSSSTPTVHCNDQITPPSFTMVQSHSFAQSTYISPIICSKDNSNVVDSMRFSTAVPITNQDTPSNTCNEELWQLGRETPIKQSTPTIVVETPPTEVNYSSIGQTTHSSNLNTPIIIIEPPQNDSDIPSDVTVLYINAPIE